MMNANIAAMNINLVIKSPTDILNTSRYQAAPVPVDEPISGQKIPDIDPYQYQVLQK